MKRENGVFAVVLAGKQGSQLHGFKLFLEVIRVTLYLLGGVLVVLFLHGKLYHGKSVLKLFIKLVVAFDSRLVMLDSLHDLLGVFNIVPEAVFAGLLLQFGYLGFRPVNVKYFIELLHILAVALKLHAKFVK